MKKKLVFKINFMNSQSFIAGCLCFVVFEWSLLSPSRCFFFQRKNIPQVCAKQNSRCSQWHKWSICLICCIALLISDQRISGHPLQLWSNHTSRFSSLFYLAFPSSQDPRPQSTQLFENAVFVSIQTPRDNRHEFGLIFSSDIHSIRCLQLLACSCNNDSPYMHCGFELHPIYILVYR